MSWEFVLGITVAVLAVLAFLWKKSAKKDFIEAKSEYDKAVAADTASSDYRAYVDRPSKKDMESAAAAEHNSSKVVTIALASLAAILMFFASAYTVPVRNVGIVSTFNRPTGDTTGSGLHFVWPWQSVEDFDASVVTINHLGNWKEGCTTVRIGSLATACVENRIQLQVTETGAPKLFLDYKGDFNNVKNNLYETVIQNALNDVFATYNPLSQVNLQTGQVGFDGTQLQTDVKNKLVTAFDGLVDVKTVSIPLVHHDAQTEKNIQQFQDVIAQARVLAQKKTNALAEKAVSDLLAQVLTPLYVQNKCIEESVKMGVPPGLCLAAGGGVLVSANAGGK